MPSRAHVEVHHRRLARGRRKKAEQDLDQRALAGAVGPDEADDPGFELEGQAVERDHPAWVPLRQIPKGDEAHDLFRVPVRDPAMFSAETDARDDPVGLGQDRFERGVSRRLDGDHEDPIVAIDDDEPRRPERLEVERLRARAEQRHPIRAGRSQVDDRRLVLVDLARLRPPGGDPIGVDERLGDQASRSWRIGRVALRIDADRGRWRRSGHPPDDRGRSGPVPTPLSTSRRGA